MTEHNNSSQDAESRWIETGNLTVRYNPATETYRTVCSWGNESFTTTVVEAVEAIQDNEVTELPPLFERVDPDALEQLFQSTADSEHQRTAGRLTFPYAGFLVTIHADGEITFNPLPDN